MITPDEFQVLRESPLRLLDSWSAKTQLDAIKTQFQRNSSYNSLIKSCFLASMFQDDRRQMRIATRKRFDA